VVRRDLLAVLLLAGAFGQAPSAVAEPPAKINPYTLYPPAGVNNLSGVPDDETLAQRVRATLAQDALLRDSAITVESNSQVITLTGTASSDDARNLAGSDAEKVAGVKAVTNQISVDAPAASASKPSDQAQDNADDAAASDAKLASRVTQALLDASPAYGHKLTVQAHDGMVSLSGTLDDPDALPRVRELVGRVEGVRGVDTSALQSGAK
jgi:osmotically-inducible protein OsmY